MDSSHAKYEGKPTVYLDHNILDLLAKNKNLPIKDKLTEQLQVVYSDETLKEIKRSGDGGNDFLEVLTELEAMYLKLVLTQSFEVTGDATLTEIDPFVAFDNYCELIDPIYEEMEQSTTQSLLKFYGGREGSGFDEINQEQIVSFDSLMGQLQDQSRGLDNSVPNLKESVELYAEEAKRSFKEALAQSTNELRKHVDDELNYSGIRNYREYTEIGPVQLNNIEQPNVIEKIWERHKELKGYKEHNFTIEQFLGVSLNPIYNREMYIHEKVSSAYNVLNMVGYYPDTKMKKERRFVAAMSDAGHASIATFANCILSRDIPFIKKTKAVYEFLNINTKVYEIEVK